MDLRPGYRELRPPPVLRDALACLWVRVVGPEGAPPARVLPDACVDLMWQAGRGGFVAGPDTGPVIAPMEPGAIVIGARFLPGAGGPALRIPLSELRDARVDLADLSPQLHHRLPGTLAPRTAARRVAATAEALARGRPPDFAVRRAALLLSEPQVRVRQLASELGLSERQLLRRCHATVGYGPKTLHRVLRFRRFLTQADALGARADLARIAIETGYTDQAHLTHDCRRLAGMAPAALVRARMGS